MSELVADLFAWHALYKRSLRNVLLLRNSQVGSKAQRGVEVVDAHLQRSRSISRGAHSRCVWIERINLKFERLGRVDDDALQVETLGEGRKSGEAVDLNGTVHL